MAPIPTAGNWVRLKELHPRMKYRLEKFFLDPRIKGKVVKVWSVPAPEFYEEEDLDIPSTVEEDF